MCSKFTSNKGNVLLGFEHLTHEIWVDNNQPLIPNTLIAKKKFTTAYDNLDFENTQFRKIAVIKSFYLDDLQSPRTLLTERDRQVADTSINLLQKV
jgi:hypothetical protein